MHDSRKKIREQLFPDKVEIFTSAPEWTKWSAWSSCSQSCGGGERTRERNCGSIDASLPITDIIDIVSRQCPGNGTEVSSCGEDQCPGTFPRWKFKWVSVCVCVCVGGGDLPAEPIFTIFISSPSTRTKVNISPKNEYSDTNPKNGSVQESQNEWFAGKKIREQDK